MKSSNNISSLKASEASKAYGASGASGASKLLIITYYWPPCGGAGVQRWLKFSKYLPEFGWEPVILTVDPWYASFPATDSSLEKEVPSNMRIEKTRAVNYFSLGKKEGQKAGVPSAGFATGNKESLSARLARFIRGNFFIPDPRRGWNRYAFRKACELIEELKISHVLTTSPPHSTQLIGLKLKKRYPGIKWIADLRDPWTDIYYYRQFYPGWIPRNIDTLYEKNTFHDADIITQAGSHISPVKIKKYNLDPAKIKTLYNGYDIVDFDGIERNAAPEFTISYVGSISDQYPVGGLIKAIKLLQKENIKLRIRFVGQVQESVKSTFAGSLPRDNVTFIPYMEHHRAVKIMTDSQLLLLIIPDHSRNRNIVPGKLFEYMGSGNPVLCIGPHDSDVSKILNETGSGKSFTDEDSVSIAGYIAEVFNSPHHYIIPDKYTRKSLASLLASYLSDGNSV